MSEKQSIEALLQAHHRIPPGALGGVDSRTLLEIAGRADIAIRNRALDELVRRREPLALEILTGFLFDERFHVGERASHAVRIGQIALPGSEGTLLSALQETRDELLLPKICGALARCGSELCVDRVDELADRSTGPLARMAHFAASVVRHRLGMPVKRSPLSEFAERMALLEPGLPFAGERIGHSLAQTVAYGSVGDSYGLGLRIGPAFRVRCKHGLWIIVLSGTFVDEGIGALLRRTMLFGVVFTYHSEDESYSTSRLLLAGPEGDDHCYVAAYRQDGILAHVGVGKCRPSSAQLDFWSASYGGNFGLEATARIRGEEIAFAGFTGSSRTAGRREPGSTAPPEGA